MFHTTNKQKTRIFNRKYTAATFFGGAKIRFSIPRLTVERACVSSGGDNIVAVSHIFFIPTVDFQSMFLLRVAFVANACSKFSFLVIIVYVLEMCGFRCGRLRRQWE